MLPVADIFPQLLALLQQHNKVILSAPPGAGKSTYLPLYLLQHADFAGKKLLMLEPRRLAAKSIAAYLAAQLGEAVGDTVGYQIRQEQKHSSKTRLLIVTEGVLTRKLQQDPELNSVDLLLFDEFHERSLHADLALALCLEVQQLRPQLQLLIMSATLDMAHLADKLAAPVVSSEGRSYPVTVEYALPGSQPLAVQMAALVQQALSKHQGNILVFLPGQAEINQTAQLLQQQGVAPDVQLHRLLGSLTLVQQQAAIAPPPAGMRKVVLSTNLAETSLTIDGISVVIDSGLCRQSRFNPRQGLSVLETAAISQASAIQRAGRAGRLSPGHCYRLDTAEKWQRRARFEAPEIEISDLTALRLEVAAWGCQVDDLSWLTAPPAGSLAVAEQLLQQLGFIDSKGVITKAGRQAHKLGTEPRLAAMLLHAQTLEQQGNRHAQALACVLAALLEDTRALQGDIYSLLGRVKQTLPPQWLQAQSFARLLGCQLTEQLPLELTAILALRAFPDRLAKRRGQGYQLANGIGAALQDNHSLTGQDWLVVLHMQQFGRENRIYHALSIATDAITADWQAELGWQTYTIWDEKSGRFYTEQQLNFGQCLLQAKPAALQLTAEQKQQAWQSYIRSKGLSCLNWSDAALQLRARVTLLQQYQPEVGWPDFSDDALLNNLPQWLGAYLAPLSKSAALSQIPLYDALLACLSYPQQQLLNQLLPTHWQVPTGSRISIDYCAEGGPRLSVRVQEMYGQMSSPAVLQGQLNITVELLSPSRQPLQVTQNLASFWQNAWQEARKEMRGRYPKHYWPEDPAQAMPTTKTKRAMLK
ncbi:ATP-dependent helicase HrpB [Rheinheimera maricola]|uniref:ATP-dependent helicase HrpB n=1 Tax=Rheinheimera maricola TaxID=2793282 RepID=A0ABS7X6G6_9GAMM|nr:ATP-dependent helicase HrpB [Rheinheimera maricola]